MGEVRHDEEFIKLLEEEFPDDLREIRKIVESLKLKGFMISYDGIGALKNFASLSISQESTPKENKEELRTLVRKCSNILRDANKEDIERKKIVKELKKYELMDVSRDKDFEISRMTISTTYEINLQARENGQNIDLNILCSKVKPEYEEHEFHSTLLNKPEPTELALDITKNMKEVIKDYIKNRERELISIEEKIDFYRVKFNVTYKESKAEAAKRELTKRNQKRLDEIKRLTQKLNDFDKRHGKGK